MAKEQLSFSELEEFLEKQMRLSHIYQPLLVKLLVEAGGKATIRQLALSFLKEDEGLIRDYEKRLAQMPIRVLSKHGIVTKDDDVISLNVRKLTLEQKADISLICEKRIKEYIKSRGIRIWDYRLLDLPVDDNLRYRVLKEAKGRCALCGATKEKVPLDVDHIIPLSKGGKTEYSNLQVLCAKCNRTKRNLDDKDFRKLEESFKSDCTFCKKLKNGEFEIDNELAFAIPDAYPVTKGHVLVLPKRHVSDYFDLSEAERKDINDLLRIMKKDLLESDKKITGFNTGVNIGESAGQSIEHCHVHLIPRRDGDSKSPRGGVRGVIHNKQDYPN